MATIIAMLIALGLLGSPQEFDDLTTEQQNDLIVIIDDINV